MVCCVGRSIGQDGTLDLSFNVGTGLNQQVFAMAIQADGKVLVGGLFTSYNGTPCNYLARLNPDGSFDNTFSIGTGPNDKVTAMAVQPDGKILVGGHFVFFNGVLQNHLARLNSNGSLDPTFVPDFIGLSPSLKIQVQPDGKILVLEDPAPTILRLNANGTTDQSIPVGTFSTNNVIFDFELQPDGKILVSGGFTMHNGTPRNQITRINPDFTLDPTFVPGSGANWIHAIARQADGKILIAGEFSAISGTPRPGIARLNSGGSLDASFNTDTIGGIIVTGVVPQPDGKVLVMVQFPFDAGPPLFGIEPFFYRVNANGSLDTGFQLGTGPNGYVRKLAVQADGKILIGGSFTTYNGTNRNNIARINGTARARIKVLLEGPYSGGQMTDALRALPTFPLTAPFTSMGYAESGYVPGATIHSSTLSVTGNNAIVDWVIVEMRPVATPATVVAARAVLLQRDGDVVDLDGTSTVGFAGLAAGNYCVAVK
ncbi:MAG: delta-60 repeat domain-containing protein, partial [Flavobacteriales bacterium]|nr:delta-60 repeat domain-containing protein [Flavobacteriales bacterium]